MKTKGFILLAVFFIIIFGSGMSVGSSQTQPNDAETLVPAEKYLEVVKDSAPIKTKKAYIASEQEGCSESASGVDQGRIQVAKKPVIYLYPPKEEEVTVKLIYHGKIISSYPEYDNTIKGWKVIAYPDGHLVNLADRAEYSYLFWEGTPDNPLGFGDMKGFVVAGKDTALFLQQILKEMGLTSREYNEFIVYWLPKMKDNPYNFIHFSGREYTDTACLDIQPKPDSMLRVFMVFRPMNSKADAIPQDIKVLSRTGFTVVEWGGTELK